jgi:hypothetical protein
VRLPRRFPALVDRGARRVLRNRTRVAAGATKSSRCGGGKLWDDRSKWQTGRQPGKAAPPPYRSWRCRSLLLSQALPDLPVLAILKGEPPVIHVLKLV